MDGTDRPMTWKELVDENILLKTELSRWKRYEAVCNCGLTISQHSQTENHSAVEMVEPCPNLEQLQEISGWLQAVLTALNTGNIESESLLHQKLREVMIEYRNNSGQ